LVDGTKNPVYQPLPCTTQGEKKRKKRNLNMFRTEKEERFGEKGYKNGLGAERNWKVILGIRGSLPKKKNAFRDGRT